MPKTRTSSTDSERDARHLAMLRDLMLNYATSEIVKLKFLHEMADRDRSGRLNAAIKEAERKAMDVSEYGRKSVHAKNWNPLGPDWVEHTPDFGSQSKDSKLKQEYVLGMFEGETELQAITMHREAYVALKAALHALKEEKGTYTPDLQFVAMILLSNSRSTLTPEYAAKLAEEFRDAVANPPKKKVARKENRHRKPSTMKA